MTDKEWFEQFKFSWRDAPNYAGKYCIGVDRREPGSAICYGTLTARETSGKEIVFGVDGYGLVTSARWQKLVPHDQCRHGYIVYYFTPIELIGGNNTNKNEDAFLFFAQLNMQYFSIAEQRKYVEIMHKWKKQLKP